MFGGAVILALCAGNAPLRVWLAMLLNLAATITFAADPYIVAAFDLICAIVLIGAGARAHVVAALFAAMVPFYIVGQFAHWPPSTTYGIVEVVAYLQIAVIGNVDGGIYRAYRRSVNFGRNRLGRAVYTVEIRSEAQQFAGMVSGEGKA